MARKKADAGRATAKQRKIDLQNARRARYVQGWAELGIDKSIITKFDLRNKNPERVSDSFLSDIKSQSRVAKTRATKARNQERRRQQLINEGFKAKDIKPGMIMSDRKLYELLGRTDPNRVYRADKHIALSFAHLQGDVVFNTSAYRGMSYEEIKEKLNDRINGAVTDVDDSDSFRCAFQMFTGSESECEAQQSQWDSRGYNLKVGKLTDRRYYRMVNRNDWTMREFAEMMLCVLDQAHNKDVENLYNQFKFFAHEANLPFDEIFTT